VPPVQLKKEEKELAPDEEVILPVAEPTTPALPLPTVTVYPVPGVTVYIPQADTP
jgi:hypothetical protein